MPDADDQIGLGWYNASQIKQVFMILAASGQLDSFEKACNKRGLKIHIDKKDQDFVQKELNKILSEMVSKYTAADKSLVAHQGCPC